MLSLSFWGHAQEFKLNKVGHANFIEFQYDGTNHQNEWAFEKTNKPCFHFFFYKLVDLVVEGLLTTRPTASS